jgi:hypothetical protein
MNCERINPLLYLFKEGELDLREASIVREHLKTCKRCAAEAVTIQRTVEHAAISAQQELSPSSHDELLELIMTDVAQPSVKEKSFLVKWLFLPFPARRVQFALGTMVATILLPLVVQLYYDALRVQQLEQAATRSITSGTRFELPPVISAGAGAPTLPGISAIDVTAFYELFSRFGLGATSGKLTPQQKSFAEYYMRKYPELSRINLEDGIDAREQRILQTEGAALIKELQTLAQSGGSNK